MLAVMSILFTVTEFLRCIFGAFGDAATFFCLRLRSSSALAAENLFLRKQLALYVELKRWPRQESVDKLRDTARIDAAQAPGEFAIDLRGTDAGAAGLGVQFLPCG
jgi:hypothetical protein